MNCPSVAADVRRRTVLQVPFIHLLASVAMRFMILMRFKCKWNLPMKLCLKFFLILLWAGQAAAEPNKDFPKVDDTSYTEANGDRVIRLATVAPSSAEEVWQTLTTNEGWKSFAVAFASMEMKVGGIIETSYNPKAQPGDPDNIKNEIVAYVPGRMIAIRCVQTPRNFKHKEEFFATSTVLEIVPMKRKQTRVILTAVGYRAGEAYDALFKHFRWGDAYTLNKLRLRFETGHPSAPIESEETKSFNGATNGRK
jgi:uncharacterized protein YndB with AHSA1/START domain